MLKTNYRLTIFVRLKSFVKPIQKEVGINKLKCANFKCLPIALGSETFSIRKFREFCECGIDQRRFMKTKIIFWRFLESLCSRIFFKKVKLSFASFTKVYVREVYLKITFLTFFEEFFYLLKSYSYFYQEKLKYKHPGLQK